MMDIKKLYVMLAKLKIKAFITTNMPFANWGEGNIGDGTTIATVIAGQLIHN